MINLLPPAARPALPEGHDARARREAAGDFAQWLQHPPGKGALPQQLEPPSTDAHPAVPASDTTPATPMSEPVSQSLMPSCPEIPAPAQELAVADATPSDIPAVPAPPAPQTPPAPPEHGMRNEEAGILQTAEPPHAFELPATNELPSAHAQPATLPAHEAITLPSPVTHGAHEHPMLADAVLLPWRLQANAGLSYLGHAAWLPASIRDAIANQGSEAIGTIDATSAAQLSDAGQPTIANPRRGALAWVAYLSEGGARNAEREQRLERLNHWLSTHPDWKEKLLRWVGDEADLTAWIRDFQLGQDDLGELVQKLREYAAEHGHPLTRVMHNGHEVWRAPTTHLQNGSNS